MPATNFTGVATDAAANGSQAAVQAVTLGASPYAYTPNARGAVTVSGGTVTVVALKRNGVSTTLPGVAGVYPCSYGDQIVITYSVAPTVEFIPL